MLKVSSLRLVTRASAVCLILLIGLWGCGDDAAKKDKCPDGSVCDATENGALADAGNAGTTAGTAGTSAGTSAAGTSAVGTTAGTSAAGTSAADGGTAGTGSTPAVGKPATDGTQFASCDPRAAMACNDGLACYTADGATPVGFCTKTCTMDSDCTALGAAFTCSSATQGVTTQYCRATCAGADDDSCPSMMTCTQVTGGFRCLYDEKDLGTGAATAWQECTISGDCAGDLVCYPDGVTTFTGTFKGACVGTCMMDTDCTDVPATGNIKPSCGGGGNCILDCSTGNNGGPGGPGGGATDAGGMQCPEGMQCASLGNGRARCMYQDTTGGI